MNIISESSKFRTENVKLYDNKVAEKFYDDRYQNRYMESWPLEKCLRITNIIQELPLPFKGRVLDFGCGAGVFTSVLKSVLPDWEVHGTDISSNALEIARTKQPNCIFHELADCENMFYQFDLIFSHHVLEHVSNLSKTAELLESLIKPSGAMLHILPCADPGSLEYSVCMLRRDGIVGEPENRFIYDEEGHLRRLSTQQLASLWESSGFYLERAYYSNKLMGGLKFLTNNGLQFILDFTCPAASRDRSAKIRLILLRCALTLLWVLRKPTDIVNNKMKFGLKNVRDYFLISVSISSYPVSKTVEWILDKIEKREWARYRNLPGGSEMYVFLVRD